MRILVLGSGGREHALAWTLARSPQAPKLFIAPGNAGTATLGTNVPIAATQIDALVAFAQAKAIDLTVVGPEQPLVAGIVDAFQEAELAIVGPTQAAARLEGSKAFAKAFMERHDIPTASYRTFATDAYEDARAYVTDQGAPIVVKASGLAAGKGAIVCRTLAEAYDALDEILQERAFGEAGDEVVVEAFMEGEEASIFALTDGDHYVLFAPAQDHKRVGEGDTGPNTGGMGAYAPAPVIDGRLLTRVCREIIEPTLAGMKAEGHPYQGFLYVGLMITEAGPQVVEYNCRLGDPEAQVVLPMLSSDLVDVLHKLTLGRLREVSLRVDAGASACVVLASGGYPGGYEKGKPIRGLGDDGQVHDATDEVVVFHAGTARTDDGFITNGGRVLAVSALGDSLHDALSRAYEVVPRITFDGVQYRRDIGRKGLDRLDQG